MISAITREFATMTGLMESRGYHPAAVMEEFARWMTEAKHTPHGKVFDIGNATSAAIGRYLGGTEPTHCGGTGEWSNGNGSLMRILPLGLAYADDPDLIEKAWDISSLTHAHERSLLCCAFHCLAVSDLLHGGAIEEATAFAWEVMDERWSFSVTERKHFEALHPDRLFAMPEDRVGSSGHVIDTIGASLWVNARHDNYGDAVLHAVNLGEDTDTTGCVAGGLAGLIHGEEKIPDEWLRMLARRGHLEEQAGRFAGYCGEAALALSAASAAESEDP
jgi:ADP-ribosylglycohydrolase